jgi:regulator of cell morphogenesis and NO signaling
MKFFSESTVGELAAKDYRKVEVFKKYGIDFCCGGKKSLSHVCNEKKLNREQLEIELAMVETSAKLPSQNFTTWDPAFLSDYIVNTHHKYIVQALPLILEFSQKVANVHGHEHPEVIEAASIFRQVTDEINQYMMKEENILFPYIKYLSQVKASKGRVAAPGFGSAMNSIKMMEHEHDVVGELMHEIRKITSDYILPTEACNSYRFLFSKLNEFEEDLHQHIHLENNILFPMTIELEKELSE